ncbi:MAG: glycosyltransferase family 2 protein [Planctomycetaceae bacterium]
MSAVILLKLICLSSLGLVAYCYAAYPLLVSLCARLIGRRDVDDAPSPAPEQWPFVSLIIAAYKEERTILARVQNALQMDYPADRLEVLIGCDGHEDATGELVQTVQDSRIRLLQFPQRRGKPSVLNDCVASSQGEILAFSDANTFYEPDALKRMVRHYQRPNVGGVVGELELIDPHTGANVDGLYWRYENFLKNSEGRLGALLGANGAIYSLRRELWQPLAPETIVDDFVAGMRVHLADRELVFEPEAVAEEESAPTMRAEFQRRARLGAGAFQSLNWLSPLLNPARGAVAWAFWSHKVLRWFTPLFLAAALVTNVGLAREPGFGWLFAVQLIVYSAAVLGMWVPARRVVGRMLRLATMFCSMNAAITVGFWRWLRGEPVRGVGADGAWRKWNELR